MKMRKQQLEIRSDSAEKRPRETGEASNDPLSPQEQQLLSECESILRQRQQSFLALGKAFAQIHNSRLYRRDSKTFPAYCRNKWRYGKSQVYYLIAASDLVAHLSTIVDILPQHESQVRPLVSLTKDQALSAWQKAVAIAAGKTVTAKLVKTAVAEFQPGISPIPKSCSKLLPKPECLSPLLDQLHSLLRQVEQGIRGNEHRPNLLTLTDQFRHHLCQLATLIL
jgi:hypothetical protein